MYFTCYSYNLGSGDVYTFGRNKFGSLGIPEAKGRNILVPKKVKFFEEEGLVVKKVVVGNFHTLAVTEDGDVYSWGQGHRNFDSFLISLLWTRSGALGHKSTSNIETPTLIQALKGKKIVDLASGLQYAHAVDVDGNVYSWGNGEWGVLGTESSKAIVTPELNPVFSSYKDDIGITVDSIVSCRYSNIAKMKNGDMYCWGSADHEHLNLPSYQGFTMSETVKLPMPMDMTKFGGKPVMYDVSECITAVLCGKLNQAS